MLDVSQEELTIADQEGEENPTQDDVMAIRAVEKILYRDFLDPLDSGVPLDQLSEEDRQKITWLPPWEDGDRFADLRPRSSLPKSRIASPLPQSAEHSLEPAA